MDVEHYTYLHESVQHHIDTIKDNIARRKQELEDDLNANILLENRVVSEKLSSVRGMETVLNHSKLKKASYEKQQVADVHSHGSVTRADLHKRFNAKY